MSTFVSSQDLAEWLASDRLFAVFDVRERGEYNQGQIPGATSLPRSQIEFRIRSLVPNRKLPLIVYDGADGRGSLAAETLAELGYSAISILGGGLPAWRREGRPTVSGVNVPSKSFGEKIHRERNISDVTPEELQGLAARGEEFLILDVRTPEEYGRFCIPGGLNVPGGDLILWADELQKKAATVIVNCAGRTRSIVGTAALRRLGLTNVRALKNGTMGWVLAGLELEKNPNRASPEPSVQSRAAGLSIARRIAAEEKLNFISPPELWRRRTEPSDGFTYFIDIRSEAEFASGHIAASIHVPGGQAVQRADDFIAVRNAEIVFISNESARAVMAAYWYRQMSFARPLVLEGGLRAWSETGYELIRGAANEEPWGFAAAELAAAFVDAQSLAMAAAKAPLLILNVGSSLDFEAAHLPGAKWISRGWLELELPRQFPDRQREIVVTCADGRQSVFAAQALDKLGYKNVRVLASGVRAWRAAGMKTETGMEGCLMQANDVVLSPSIRGSREDMQRYLDWEVKLTQPP